MSNPSPRPARKKSNPPVATPSATKSAPATGAKRNTPATGRARTGSAKPATSKPASPAAKATSKFARAARSSPAFEYDVCVSFAGENREFVQQVVTSLKRRRLRCFYDRDEQARLWGTDLYTHLDEVYRKKARYCVMFVSQHYLVKLWTNHERQSIQSRVFEGDNEYLLPVRLDDTDIPGLRPTLGYLDGRRHTPSQVAAMVQAKVQGKPTAAAALRPAAKPAARPAGAPPTAAKSAAVPPVKPVRSNASPRKVTDSGKWMLLDDTFFEAAHVVREKDTLRVQISPKNSRQEVELQALDRRPQWQRSNVTYAYRNSAMRCRLQDVKSESEKGKTVYTLLLQPEEEKTNSWELGWQNLSADQIAEKRAHLILLGEKPATGDEYLDQHILRGLDDDAYQAGLITQMLAKHGGMSLESLQKTWLVTMQQLVGKGIVEHVVELALGPVTKAGVAVRFEGWRHGINGNKPAAIHVSGHVPAPEK